jgi:hypothetical protein
VAKLNVTRCVNENCPKRVPIPEPSVVTTIVLDVGSESVSVPCIVPLKGTCFSAAAATACDDDVTDGAMDGVDVGAVGDVD